MALDEDNMQDYFKSEESEEEVPVTTPKAK